MGKTLKQGRNSEITSIDGIRKPMSTGGLSQKNPTVTSSSVADVRGRWMDCSCDHLDAVAPVKNSECPLERGFIYYFGDVSSSF